MKLLLTSAGIMNPSINDALVGLLGKPIGEASAERKVVVGELRWSASAADRRAL